MKIIDSISSLRAEIASWRQAGERIAFVPTMGNLHQGHLRLVEVAKQQADRVIASIFVNPMQFGANEDLDNYPRTLQDDCAALQQMQTDAVFTPTPEIIYPRGLAQQSFVEVPELGDHHCGSSRPGHFRGVATVVAKLFNLVQPDVACFGQKDYQQLAIIRQMVEDLSFPIEIIGVPTERAADGLALSSRNAYLTVKQRAIAPTLQEVLQQVSQQIKRGETDFRQLESEAKAQLSAAGFRPDYLNISDRETLQPADSRQQALVILAAAWLGNTKLLDNLEV
ncbi:pantoate--beta-alanine ligase [Alkalimonas collagenimarina]|uniref:Pantothenate synthetase n=1 Tax=Alkalimonas collagenimarina TaxID=400390 RepID=A0ABT9GYV2_9GAMM|nr:pantoate--beta-alanine ligase [Alkalimonas collagenimarina]MDP4536241.1 pantoate--beta-alanine ligase [Alkalimonas collagenimarina]